MASKRADGVVKEYEGAVLGQCFFCQQTHRLTKVALDWSEKLAYRCPRCGGLNSVARIENEAPRPWQ